MFTFPKQDRISSTLRGGKIFHQGIGVLCPPLSIKYICTEGNGKVCTIILCPKRYQKLSVHRNRIKRLMREAYRLNSLPLKSYAKANHLDIDIAFTYISKQKTDFLLTQTAMVTALYEIMSKK